MNTETNKPLDEEEYRPAEYDTSSVFETTPAGTAATGGTASNKAANILEHLKRKNIIIAVIVVVAVFCVYKIVDVLFTPGAPRHKNTPPAQAQTARQTTQAAQPPAPVRVENISPANPANSQTAINSVNNRLDMLEQNTYTEQTNIERLNTQMNDLQTSLSNMDSKLANLTASLQTLTNEAARQQETAKAKENARKKATQAAKAAPMPVYYVKAMVPGRAWLVTGSGNTMTVSLGSNLPGYGIVQVIDTTQGILMTSSGAIIGYSPGDS